MSAPPPWVFIAYPFVSLALALFIGRVLRWASADFPELDDNDLPAVPARPSPAGALKPPRHGRQPRAVNDERATGARLYDRSRFGVRAEPRS